jgi:hypothetical protein
VARNNISEPQIRGNPDAKGNAMLRVIGILLLAAVYQTATAQQDDEKAKDYLVYASVYQWYGELDSNENWRQNHPQVTLDFEEYPQNNWTQGAHQILDIAPVSEDSASNNPLAGHQVRVTLEFYPAVADSDHVTGQYMQQLITFSPDYQQVLKVETEMNERDDFESRYIASADTNLIRAFLYSWTQGLDEPDTASLTQWLASDAQVNLAETQIAGISGYQAHMQAQGLTQSRRVIRNLKISPLDEQQYQVGFEYQWSAINGDDETEIADIGVSLRLSVVDGKVLMHVYTEQYIAPKTDLGAEVRC